MTTRLTALQLLTSAFPPNAQIVLQVMICCVHHPSAAYVSLRARLDNHTYSLSQEGRYLGGILPSPVVAWTASGGLLEISVPTRDRRCLQ